MNALEVSALVGGVVADVGLLLFVDLSSVDDFFDGALGNETEYFDVAALADSEGPILGLEIVCWIPIGVKKYSSMLNIF